MLKALTLLVLLALVSCSSKPTATNTDIDTNAEPTIVGTWQWKETISAWRPDTTTPATCGCTRGLRFTEAGTYERLENNSVVASGNYTIVKDSVDGSEPSYSLQFETGGLIPIKLSTANLDFDSRAWDGPLERYTR